MIYTDPLKQKTQKCLEVMNNNPFVFAIILDHKYSKSTLRYNGVHALKDIDHDRYNLLKSASDSLSSGDKTKQLIFYLCQASKKKICERYDDEETIEVQKWYDCKGEEVFKRVGIEIFDRVLTKRNEYTGKMYEAHIINMAQERAERRVDPYTRRRSRPRQQSDTSCLDNYNKCMLVVLNKCTPEDFLFNISLCKGLESVVDLLFKQALKGQINNEFMIRLNLVLKRLSNEETYLENDSWIKIIQILDKIGELNLILEFIKNMKNMKVEKISDFIANWIVKYDLENIMPVLKIKVRADSAHLNDNCLIIKVNSNPTFKININKSELRYVF